MKIETLTVTRTMLSASENTKLTNGMVYVDSVVLSEGDNPDNWHEITIEEYDAIMAEQEKENDI